MNFSSSACKKMVQWIWEFYPGVIMTAHRFSCGIRVLVLCVTGVVAIGSTVVQLSKALPAHIPNPLHLPLWLLGFRGLTVQYNRIKTHFTSNQCYFSIINLLMYFLFIWIFIFYFNFKVSDLFCCLYIFIRLFFMSIWHLKCIYFFVLVILVF